MDLFTNTDDQTTIDPNKDYFAELVGEDKKFKTPQDLAKAKAQSDAFIQQLINEKRELEAQVQTRSNEQAFLDQLKSVVQPPSTPVVPTPAPQGDLQRQTVDQNTLEELVQKAIETRSAQAERDRNLASVAKTLQEQFGPAYAQHINSLAQEIGVPKDWLNDLAARSPQAFFKMLGIGEKTPVAPVTAPPTAFNPAAHASRGVVKNWDYYKQIMKTDPARFNSKAIQDEMFASARELGPNFNPGG